MSAFKVFRIPRAIVVDAREVHVWREAARAHRRGDAHGVLTETPAGIAGHAAADDLRHHRQLRANFQNLRFALQRRRHELDHIAETPGAQGMRERIGACAAMATVTAQLLPHEARPFHHGAQLHEGHFARQVHEPAVGIDGEALGWKDPERPPDAVGDDGGRLDVVRLDVDGAEPDGERHLELLEQLQVLVAAPGKLERDRLDLCLADRGEQVPVAALPGRLAIPVAVADVQRQMRIDAIDHRVDGADRPRQIFRKARIVRLVDLQIGHARPRELAQLQVQHARQIEREGLLGRVVAGSECA